MRKRAFGCERDPKARLAAIGDAFMRSFDDESASLEPRTQSTEGTAGAREGRKGAERQESPGDTSTSSGMSSGERSGDSSGESGGDRQATAWGRHEAATAAAARDAPVEVVFQRPGRRQLASSGRAAGGMRGGTAAGSRGQGLGGGAAQPAQDANFDFDRAFREVQELGARSLDRKKRKALEARRLTALNMRPEKSPRTPASLGKGFAKAAAERAHKAREEAIAAGMLQVKGSGKKKRREEGKGRVDRGLMEDGGAFRKGALRVKGPVKRGKTGRIPNVNKIRF